MRQCEFKKQYDPNLDMHVRKHIHGEGFGDIFRSVGRKLFGRTAKSMAKKAAAKAVETTGKKAGDKIVELLSRKNTKTPARTSVARKERELTAQEVNDRISNLLAGGKHGKRNFI